MLVAGCSVFSSHACPCSSGKPVSDLSGGGQVWNANGWAVCASEWLRALEGTKAHFVAARDDGHVISHNLDVCWSGT